MLEPRHYRGDNKKLAMMSRVSVGGAILMQVMQRQGMVRQQIHAWRDELKRGGLWSPDVGAMFLPINASIIPDLPVVTNLASAIWIGLRPARGRILRFERSIDDKGQQSL